MGYRRVKHKPQSIPDDAIVCARHGGFTICDVTIEGATGAPVRCRYRFYGLGIAEAAARVRGELEKRAVIMSRYYSAVPTPAGDWPAEQPLQKPGRPRSARARRRQEKIRELLAAGKHPDAIAAVCDCSASHVYNLRRIWARQAL